MFNISKHLLMLLLLTTTIHNAFCAPETTRWSAPRCRWIHRPSDQTMATEALPYYLAHAVDETLPDAHIIITPSLFDHLVKERIVDTLNEYPSLNAITADNAKLEELAAWLQLSTPLIAVHILNHLRRIGHQYLSSHGVNVTPLSTMELNLTPLQQHQYISTFARLLGAADHLFLKNLLPFLFTLKNVFTLENAGQNCDELIINFIEDVFEALLLPNLADNQNTFYRIFTVNTYIPGQQEDVAAKRIFFAMSAYPQDQRFSMHIAAYNLLPENMEQLKLNVPNRTCNIVTLDDLAPAARVKLEDGAQCGVAPEVLRLDFQLPTT